MANATVIQVVPRLDAGGTERTTVDIANALVEAGFGAIVVTSGGRMGAQLDPAVDVVTLPVQSKNPFEIRRNGRAIAKLARERDAGLIHARSRACAWSTKTAAHALRIPWITTYHGIYNGGNVLKRYYNSIMARGDAVIANSEWTAQHIRASYRFTAKNLTVIPRGTDVHVFDPAAVSRERVAAQRAKWSVRDGQRVVLLPGRFARWKGQRVFIDAIALLQSSGRLPADVRAPIVGDAQRRTDYAGELNAAIANSGLGSIVAIHGPADDMPAAYAAADIVVSASTDPEAFGRVIAEASAMARPVIATDHGGARETVLPGASGLLVAPGDAAALAGAIAELLSRSAEARAAMGAQGRAHIAAHYTVERMCEETLTLYRMLLAR